VEHTAHLHAAAEALQRLPPPAVARAIGAQRAILAVYAAAPREAAADARVTASNRTHSTNTASSRTPPVVRVPYDGRAVVVQAGAKGAEEHVKRLLLLLVSERVADVPVSAAVSHCAEAQNL